MKNKFIIFLGNLYLIFFFFSSVSANNIDPKDFIQEIVDDVKKILIASNSKEFKSEKLTEMAKEKVDIIGIGYYSLGSYRKALNDEQKEKYNLLFKDYFLKSFTSRLADYSDPKINVLSIEVLSDKYTIVRSLLEGTDKKPEVKIDWRVYTKDPNNPLIRDLIIEGLSLARTQKEEFTSVIESNDGDITKLFVTLKEFISK